MVYLRVSQINNCAYCLDSHTRELLETIAISLMNAYNRLAISFRKTPQALN